MGLVARPLSGHGAGGGAGRLQQIEMCHARQRTDGDLSNRQYFQEVFQWRLEHLALSNMQTTVNAASGVGLDAAVTQSAALL
jgi:hypothetical protein